MRLALWMRRKDNGHRDATKSLTGAELQDPLSSLRLFSLDAVLNLAMVNTRVELVAILANSSDRRRAMQAQICAHDA